MLNNSEGALMTDHMHKICFYYERTKNRTQSSPAEAEKNISLSYLLIFLLTVFFNYLYLYKNIFPNEYRHMYIISQLHFAYIHL